MATSTVKKSDIKIDVAAMMGLIKQAKSVFPRYVALLSEWTAVNDLYKKRLHQTLDELKKHIDQLDDIVGVVSSSAQLENVDPARKSGIIPALAPNKVGEQLGVKPGKAPSKILATISKEPGKAPATTAVKRPLPTPSDEPQTKRPKSSESKMAAISASDKNDLDETANDGKKAAKKYPKPFVLMPLVNIKKEKGGNTGVLLNTNRAGKMVATARNVASTAKVTDRKTKSPDGLLKLQKDPSDLPKLDWNPVVSSTPNVGSDVSSNGPKKVSIKKVTRKSDEKVERRISLRRSADNVAQRKNSMK